MAGQNVKRKGLTPCLHLTFLKPDILQKVGKNNYSHIVGKNPNIGVRNGRIILEGQGAYKGKTCETSLRATEHLK